MSIDKWTILVAAVLLFGAVQTAAMADDEQAVFEMRETPVFGATYDASFHQLTRGQVADCRSEPHDRVKAYPELRSKRPWYGTIKFGRDFYNPAEGIEFHFVIDESGQEGQTHAAEETPSLLDTLKAALAPTKESRAESVGDVFTYDRLYFDLNRDLDLTNDPVLTPMKSVPDGALPIGSGKQKVVFNYLTVQLEQGARPVRVMPRFQLSEYESEEYAGVFFTLPVARKGKIRIGTQEYMATLCQPFVISGGFDRPHTGLFLKSVDSPDDRQGWWGEEELAGLRSVDGKHYTISTTPSGDKLIVKPYQGAYGRLEIGPGPRVLDEIGISGSLRSRAMVLPVGDLDMQPGSDRPLVAQCLLPVGDYLPEYVSVQYGRLWIHMSNNYHSDGHQLDRQGKPSVFGIKIREGETTVWDFSNQPEVMFASPAADQTFKPGDEVDVKPILIDPALDVMIRDLHNTEDGGYVALDDPTVVITDSSGVEVASGKLPFG